MSAPRRFTLQRTVDVSGASGTGHVADGVEFADGTAVIRWRTEHRSTAIYDSVGELEIIHGHGGATRVEWLDVAGPPPLPRRLPRGAFVVSSDLAGEFADRLAENGWRVSVSPLLPAKTIGLLPADCTSEQDIEATIRLVWPDRVRPRLSRWGRLREALRRPTCDLREFTYTPLREPFPRPGEPS